MKKLMVMIAIFMCCNTLNSYGKIRYSYFSYVNTLNDYALYLESGFSFGSPGTCPRVEWWEAKQSNDTIFILAYYHVKGFWPAMGCVNLDTINYTNTFSGINYINMSSNEIKGFSPGDTIFNEYDTTFDLAATSIKQAVTATTQLSVYPNPASTAISLPLAANELIVYNTYGQVVLLAHNTKAQQQIDVAQLRNGLYFVAVYDKEKNKVGVAKFYKE
ncbi:MAG: T9SS type A sorting domain-containing protein [Chitinophagaceae bacterium]|nr:T9SS type A sorting domain-containing protein [Chitinophagaceae bacterium]